MVTNCSRIAQKKLQEMVNTGKLFFMTPDYLAVPTADGARTVKIEDDLTVTYNMVCAIQNANKEGEAR